MQDQLISRLFNFNFQLVFVIWSTSAQLTGGERARGGLLPSLPRVEVSGGRQFFAAAELFLAIFSKFRILKCKKGQNFFFLVYDSKIFVPIVFKSFRNKK